MSKAGLQLRYVAWSASLWFGRCVLVFHGVLCSTGGPHNLMLRCGCSPPPPTHTHIVLPFQHTYTHDMLPSAHFYLHAFYPMR
jgi:hypothetical protein